MSSEDYHKLPKFMQEKIKVPGIEEIKPSFFTRLTIPEEMKTLSIFSCRILPDGNLIILDYRKRQLLLFSNDGIFIGIVVTFTQETYDVCFVRKRTVAVALGASNQTKLVDTEKNKIIQTIKLSHNCYGVASDGETLVISNNDRQSTRMNLNDMSHTILERMERLDCISLFQGNIYGTFPEENKVCCYDSTGEPLWTVQHQDIDYPLGITLDINGFVYTASSRNDSIVVISPDGKSCKTILSEADGIKEPIGIDINRETGIMIVSSKIMEDRSYTDFETAFVYKI
ncbi:unnamed protein product [Mytilus coruscus]|uniref:TRIM2_3 n=1 Tax=Mytilus coruscus TaxID=42192 RepID=A0A6J8CRL1_MYTCO|nr:unnamed protein product [Mytilus coruscus]